MASPCHRVEEREWAHARTIADLRLKLDAMSGFDPHDPSSVPLPVPSANEPLSRPLRVGLLRDVGAARPQPAINETLDRAAKWLGEAGYVVDEIELPILEEARRLWRLLALEEFRQVMPLVEQVGDEAIRRAASHYYEVAKEWWGATPSLADYMNGYARRGTLVARLHSFLEKCPLVLLQVSAEQAFEQDADLASVERARQVMDLSATLRIGRAQVGGCASEKRSHGESNTDRDDPIEVERGPETLVSQGLQKKRRRTRRSTK